MSKLQWAPKVQNLNPDEVGAGGLGLAEGDDVSSEATTVSEVTGGTF